MVKKTKFWQGPYVNPPGGGISITGINRFLVCPHRFWLYYVCGLREQKTWNVPMNYGKIFHLHLDGANIKKEIGKIMMEYPYESSDLSLYSQCASHQAKLYKEFWCANDSERDTIATEQFFDYTCTLPDERSPRIFGYYDEIFLEDGKQTLMETKTGSDINPKTRTEVLHMNLQTMTYLRSFGGNKVLYNLILRPLGWSSPKPRKDEPTKDFLERVFYSYDGKVKNYPIADNLNNWFKRIEVTVTQKDIDQFWFGMLAPILTRICDWWDAIKNNPEDPWQSPHHYCRPFGSYDSIQSGFEGDFYEGLINGMGVTQRRNRS